MIFQILDDKKDCLGLFCSGKFYYGQIERSFEKTWDWSPHLLDDDYEYAKIWCGGKTLEEACPEHLIDRLTVYKKRIKNFVKAASIAKINLDDVCLFDIVPEQSLIHWCQVKNDICQYIFDNNVKPSNHKFLTNLSKLVYEISQNSVVLNHERLFNYQNTDRKARSLWKSFGLKKK